MPPSLILVIDDNQLVRALLKQALTEEGFSVIEAGDGQEGLAQVKAKHPDLIITDFYMPNMDGEEFVKAIRSQHGAIGRLPIVGLAGTNDSERRLRAAGVNAYLPKPLRERALIATVTKELADAEVVKKHYRDLKR